VKGTVRSLCTGVVYVPTDRRRNPYAMKLRKTCANVGSFLSIILNRCDDSGNELYYELANLQLIGKGFDLHSSFNANWGYFLCPPVIILTETFVMVA
jgi:hypothetical protein